MAGHPVLNHQGCNRRLRIFGEQDVMAHAEADNDIKIGPGPVEEPGLGYRIAGMGYSKHPWE